MGDHAPNWNSTAKLQRIEESSSDEKAVHSAAFRTSVAKQHTVGGFQDTSCRSLACGHTTDEVAVTPTVKIANKKPLQPFPGSLVSVCGCADMKRWCACCGCGGRTGGRWNDKKNRRV